MVPTIAAEPNQQEYDSLQLLLGDDDARGILDALSCLDDCAPKDAPKTVTLSQNGVTFGPVPPKPMIVQPTQQQQEAKKPCHPYFYYRDFSTLPDPDPTTPITAPGRIPNFPAKMYAILSRKDLSDIITWLPHGRSWKVLKPREFEVKVIPTYFEHSKFSSFIRQANGWGFRRIISKGADRNSYYHELFLRGRPHLIKMMRRPPPSSKPLADASTEPDFHAISNERPLPEIKDGDAATDALARGNFPRQATYSFIPPQTQSSSSGPAPAPAPSSNTENKSQPAPVVQYSAPPQQHAPVPHLAPSSGGHFHQPHSGYHQPQQQTQYQQPVQTQQQHSAVHAEPIFSSNMPSIHPVESSDSLLDLLHQPLPPPETYGSHTFYPLTN
mmetsp:Transcript_11800/g.18912  ORF Transcript_11800/g.18912 Transcript_11800/m.18912 type:complete len:384 (-) Transcript_11800:307-1458(-)|eukprot:CAMPEP_0178757392 /NCGR_PEP_ID=MMETSP0744-20121128/13799_1 /TAXON_ID=913974 /ORGANISM="Nitzschia punctata, Strain CCMP561" /LENGTH=383 /DNA_ID=CAMNT_0020411629 /DNA_START=359 /DNA_END=1510 /DNA_ORIENTATION=-